MRKIFALGSVALALCATGDPAAAADAALPPLPPQFNWTGFFGGGHLGYAGGRARWAATEPGAGTTSLAGAFDLFDAFDAFKGTGSYFLGLGGGYNTMLASRVVLGVEADVSFPSTIRGLQTISSAATGQANYAEAVQWSGTLRGRVGYAPGPWMVYATGGLAWTYDQFTRTQVFGSPVGSPLNSGDQE